MLDRDPATWGEDATRAVYVHLLMVDRSHAGQNLGARILEQVEAKARDEGARHVRLDAGADLDELHRWYAVRGYEVVTTRTIVDAGTFEVTLRQKPLGRSGIVATATTLCRVRSRTAPVSSPPS